MRKSFQLMERKIDSSPTELVSVVTGFCTTNASVVVQKPGNHRGKLGGVGAILYFSLLFVDTMSFALADESVKKVPDTKSIAPVKPQASKTNSDKANVTKSEKKTANRAASGKPIGGEAANSLVEPVPPQREAAAMLFAQQYHPELAELLTRLRDSNPGQFTKAIRELDQTRDRLEKNRERDPERYSIMLHEWQLDSRVRLLAARLTMSTSAELETELRQVLSERHDVRLQLLTYDRERSKARLQKMDEQIAELVQSRDATVDRELDRIKKNADVRKRTMKPATKRPLK